MILYGIFLGVTRMRWCHAQNQGGDGPLKRHAAAARNANSSRRNAYQCGHQTKRHAYIHMHAHTHTHAHTQMRMHIHMHIRIHMHMLMHMRIHIRTHTHTRTQTHALAQNNHCEFWCGMHLTCKNTPIIPDLRKYGKGTIAIVNARGNMGKLTLFLQLTKRMQIATTVQ